MRTSVLAASGVALAAAVLPGIVAAPQEKPARGARVAIAAFHDSRLFTLCPAYGKDVIESNVWTSKMAAKVTVSYAPTGQQFIGLHFEPHGHARVYLPMPAYGSTSPSSAEPQASGGRELDRLARDGGVERRLAAQFSARGTYVVVDSPAAADFVFVAESTYIPMSIGTGDPPPVRPAEQRERDSAARIFSDTEAEWNRRMEWRESMLGAPAPPPPAPTPPNPLVLGFIGGDRPLNWRQSILALLVPAAAYRRTCRRRRGACGGKCLERPLRRGLGAALA